MRIRRLTVLLCLPLLLSACTHIHDYGDWITAREATCYEAGESYRVCYTCGQREIQILPALHAYGEDVCRLCGSGGAVASATAATADTTLPATTSASTAAPTAVPTGTVVVATSTTTATHPSTTAATSVQSRHTAVKGTTSQGWTVSAMLTVIDTLSAASQTTSAAATVLLGVCNSPDTAQIQSTIGDTQRQIGLVRQQIAIAQQLFLQKPPVASVHPDYDTAADHARGMLAMCDDIMAVTATGDTAAATALDMSQRLCDLLAAFVALQQSVADISISQ